MEYGSDERKTTRGIPHLCGMANIRPAAGGKVDGSWLYPHSEDVLKAAGLQTIAHYMDVHWQTVAKAVRER